MIQSYLVVSSIRTAIIDILSLLTDLPILARHGFANNVSAIDLKSEMPGHVDIPRLRKGKVGGFFWWVKPTKYIMLVTYIANMYSGQCIFLVQTL